MSTQKSPESHLKVSTLTFHDGINHGGFFQALCLSKYLQKQQCEVTVLNYKNRVHWIGELRAFLYTKRPIRFAKNLFKVLQFRSQIRKYLTLEPNKLIHDTQRLAKIVSTKDYLVIGSDIVWDHEYKMLGNNQVYFGMGLKPREGVISYAASAGRAKSNFPSQCIEALANFKSIGVRDKNTADLITKNSELEVSLNIDPTFLIPIEEQEKILDLKALRPRRRKYILVYAFHLPTAISREIRNFAVKAGLDIIVVGYPQKVSGSIDKSHVGPREWLNLFKNSDYIVTSTFHGTIYSLLYKKNFIVIGNSAIEFKVKSLLSHVRQMECYIDDHIEETSFTELLTAQLDYDYSNLSRIILQSQNYITNSLGLSK